MARTPDPKASLSEWFASAVREHRSRTGMSQTELAKHTNATQQLISFYETGRQDPTEGFARQCDKAFNTGRFFYLLWWHWKHEKDLDWWQDFEGDEQAARSIRIYQGSVVPGLLQIKDYARAVLDSGRITELDHNLERRMNRQQILTRPDPPEIQVLIDEMVLQRPFGGMATLKTQMRHLVSMAELPKVTIQLVPTRLADHAGVSGTFQVMSLPQGDVAYVEAQNRGRMVEGAEVESLLLLWDLIRSRALPVDSSRQLITSAMEAITS